MGFNLDNFNKDFIRCPHCGYQDHEWWEYVEVGDMEAEFDIECPSCDEPFHVQMSTDVWFETSKPEDEDEED